MIECQTPAWRPFTPEDYDLSNRMIGYLERFIKTGNPNGGNSPEWLPVNRSGRYMFFDVNKQGMHRIPLLHLIRETVAGKNLGMQ